MSEQILNVHTPSCSFAIPHSLTEEQLLTLYDKLTRKVRLEYNGARVGQGWLKYSWSDSIWTLDDDADYTIFSRRFTSQSTSTPTLHLHDPHAPLPVPPAYCNPSYYVFQQAARTLSPSPRRRTSSKSRHSSVRTRRTKEPDEEDLGVVRVKRDFDRFHGENGVRTVVGSIGPVKNVRMLLKAGHRHVYISRLFALKHGFVPSDAAPGHYGYGGLVNIGKWTIILDTAPDTDADGDGAPRNPHLPPGLKPSTSKNKQCAKGHGVLVSVYLSEEPHFDVVLGRSFFEARQIHTNPVDPTDVRCGDTGEKLVCELVVLRDGKGDIVSVT